MADFANIDRSSPAYLAALAQQHSYAAGSLSGGMGAQNIAAPPVPTLARAISNMEDLNKRLAQIADQAYHLAATIGGPYPTSGDNAKISDANEPAPTAMRKINDQIDSAHQRVGNLAEAIAAMSRSLGANT